MEANMDFKIEAGKFYKLRRGDKYRNYATDGGGKFPNHGSYLRDDVGYWETIEHTATGHFLEGVYGNPLDIIGPWVERPVVQWGRLPEWMPWLVQTVKGKFILSVAEPDLDSFTDDWTWHGFGSGYFVLVPNEYVQFTGPWQESKIKRPEGI